MQLMICPFEMASSSTSESHISMIEFNLLLTSAIFCSPVAANPNVYVYGTKIAVSGKKNT